MTSTLAVSLGDRPRPWWERDSVVDSSHMARGRRAGLSNKYCASTDLTNEAT